MGAGVLPKSVLSSYAFLIFLTIVSLWYSVINLRENKINIKDKNRDMHMYIDTISYSFIGLRNLLSWLESE